MRHTVKQIVSISHLGRQNLVSNFVERELKEAGIKGQLMFKNFKKCHCFEATIFNLNQNNNAEKKEIENQEDKFDSKYCYAVLMTPTN